MLASGLRATLHHKTTCQGRLLGVRSAAAKKDMTLVPESEIVIVRATPQDTESIAHNNVLLAKETEDINIPPEVSSKGVRIMLEEPTKGHYYVIKDKEDSVIAQVAITYEWSDWRAADAWWIQSVYVAPEHRRQGLFTSLYKHAKCESEEAGACGLRLYADNDNTRAHKSYEAQGMVSHYKVFEDLNTDY